jgi:hypothetical protein
VTLQALEVLTPILTSVLSTPSLSGSLDWYDPVEKREEGPFNSLSREHRDAAQGVQTGVRAQLSTPSLGITNRSLSTPVAPLSPPFNSLSRDRRLIIKRSNNDMTNPFNSLSRDHNATPQPPKLIWTRTLSTPSLGITLRIPSSRRSGRNLSTPSLGITEPDSGIFRLPAAFCRGTPSHK